MPFFKIIFKKKCKYAHYKILKRDKNNNQRQSLKSGNNLL